MKRLRAALMLLFLLCMMAVALAPQFGGGRAAAQTADPNFCAGLPESRLSKGAQAKIIGSNNRQEAGPAGAYLKPDANRVSPVLRYLPLDTVVTIREDAEPTCTLDGERWQPVSLGELKGWVTESVGEAFLLEPFTGEAPMPLPSTNAPLLFCIRPDLDAQPTREPTLGPPGELILRVVFGSEDGTVQYSDNLGATRVVATFNPPPLSVDLAPDGSAALVVNYNGMYWVDLLTGNTAFLADGTTFGLREGVWPRRVTWLPNTGSAAIELEDTRDNVWSFPLWDLSVDGLSETFRVDTGNTPPNSVRRSPDRKQAVFVTANSIEPYPTNVADEPTELLVYVPRVGEGDARSLIIPAISWALDGKGFYTYIPSSTEAPPEDPVGGRLWYLMLDGTREDLGSPPNIQPEDYVIPSPDGKHLLLGAGSIWRIQEADTGRVIQVLPPVQYLFDWTPDGKGVVFTTQEARIGYLGIDGATESPLVPTAADNLYGISWLSDGTAVYVVRGADQKLSYSVRRPGGDPVFVGIANEVEAFSAALYDTPPKLAKPLKPCE